ncbi:uncharacterized aarF domain-containing protein kinase 2 [Hypanus sabinus]|uniref:uncharacterized aarF domain-containing protein kinase 2 n=1 Tax=Hypanus sabinus TaxID=79690 RepID=UPI0028C393E6|nr:uncharacterized aarF domain-containing protein kinase 2 [Hypanus sabinus]
MAAFLLTCKASPVIWRSVIFRTPVLMSSNSASKVSLKLKSIPGLTLACLGLGVSSVANSQKAVVLEAKVTHYPKRGSSHLLLKGLFWKLRFTAHICVRAVILLLRFGPLFLLYPICFVSSSFASVWYVVLLRCMEAAGPTFVKLGQWFSTRRDLFSVEFCERFSRLHPHVTPHPWNYTKYSLKRAFGEDWRSIFHITNKEPIGSGCFTQVYRAYTDPKNINNSEFQKLVESFEREDQFEAWEVFGLRGIFRFMFAKKQDDFPDTRNEPEGVIGITELEDRRAVLHPDSTSEQQHLIPVAIKVMHPGIAHQISMDLKLMKAASCILNLLPGLKWLRLMEVVEEFEEIMLKQIDLRHEAKVMERFRENFLGMESVRFPIPLRPFVTRMVLVETFEESKPISMYLTKDVPNLLKQKLARIGLEMLLKMVFVDNFVHGELHPKNILIQGADQFSLHSDDKTTIVDLCDTLIVNVHPSQCPIKLILMDTGIVNELQPSDFHNFKAVFTALIQGQGKQIVDLLLTQARASECQDLQPFKSEIEKLVQESGMNNGSLGKLHVAGFLSKVLETLIMHKVKMESSFASMIFAIIALDGLGRSLDPELDLLEIVRPMLLKDAAGL